jgi:TPP-dependent pyruvate/acetoin dehydrogenase alpha subunit
MTDEIKLFTTMFRIRRFEETVLDEFKRGVFRARPTLISARKPMPLL